jgi:peroxiredoxin Q/BCP
MSKVTLGKKVPDFTLPATGEQNISLSDFKGKNVVVYFYPKDSTSGCTTEGQNFRDKINTFRRRKTICSLIKRKKPAGYLMSSRKRTCMAAR